MPVSYKVFADSQLVVVLYSGELTLEEIINARKEGASDPEFNPSYNVIDDITAVTASAINFDDLSSISGKSVASLGVKRALVAETDFQYGMARMYQALSESHGHVFKIFREYDAAAEWVSEKV